MSNNVKCAVEIWNKGAKNLKYWKVESTDPLGVWGEFEQGSPEQVILPKQKKRAFVFTGVSYRPGGVDAAVWYTVDGNANKAVRIAMVIRATPGRNNDFSVTVTDQDNMEASYGPQLTHGLTENVTVNVFYT
jgi:hypothetical protein